MSQRLHSPFQKLALILAVLLILRLIFLVFAPWGLHGDEAQYWAWSQELDFGYFSKPPMIAWVIGLTTALFGDAEWAVRLAAPFLHIGTTCLIFLTARKLFNSDVGFWAALIYTLMPAVWLSSFIISTDAVLLFFWALALYGWASLRIEGRWRHAIQLGLALGCGLLSKYAMAFMIPVLVAILLFDPPSRKALFGLKGLLAGALAMSLLAPNLIWNAANDFATISHTAENANLERDLFHPIEAISFLLEQIGVFGIMSFPMLLLAILAAVRQKLQRPALWIAAFAALPLCVITIGALLSRANANWAVSGYVAGAVLTALWAVQTSQRQNWLKWGLIGQTFLVLVIGGLAMSEKTIDATGRNNDVKRLRAWPETAQAVQDRANEDNYAYIATDNRLVFYDLNFYRVFPKLLNAKLNPPPPELTMWSLNATPAHHANLTRALPDTDQPVLILSYHHNFEAYFREDFKSLTPLEPIIIELGPGKTRHLKLWRGTGYKRTTRHDRR